MENVRDGQQKRNGGNRQSARVLNTLKNRFALADRRRLMRDLTNRAMLFGMVFAETMKGVGEDQPDIKTESR